MLLDVEEVKCYVTSKLQYFQKDEVLQAEEIGDGNINYVFRVWNPDSGKSIIIKQADKFLRWMYIVIRLKRKFSNWRVCWQRALYQRFMPMMKQCACWQWRISRPIKI